jgi:hypothetical protein
MDMIDGKYFHEMFANMQQTFENIGRKLDDNRSEIKELAYRTQMGDG